MTRVLITDSGLKEKYMGEAVELLESSGCELVYEKIQPGEESRLYPHLPEALAAITGGEVWAEDLFSRSVKMRIVARAGTGYDKVDVAAATKHGVMVTNTPGAMAVSVAEFAFALILSFSKDLAGNDRVARSGAWIRNPGIELEGKTLGVVGMGLIGKELIKRAVAFNMRIEACDPTWDQIFAAAHGVKRVDLDALLGDSDFVSLNLPLMKETRKLLDRDKLAKMKETAYLVNTSRGGLIDEQALFEALRDRRIAGAGLDVYATEPAAPDHPFFTLENAILSPHVSANTPEAMAAIALQAATNVVQALRGEVPKNLLNHEVLDRRRR